MVTQNQSASDQDYWAKCSSCKKEIPFSTKYYLCSVSTCRHTRKGFRFCSVPCWDEHLGFMNHREAWAEEAVSPSRAEYLRSAPESSSEDRAPKRVVMDSIPKRASGSPSPADIKTDTLIVVSKVKNLIREQSGFNTSQCCIDALTQKVVAECLRGIEAAQAAGRKTVMGRDIK